MPAVVFDVYGTLFDVSSVTAACRAVTSQPEALASVWRAKQLEYTFLRSLMGRYRDFWQVTQEALRYALRQQGLTAVPEEQRKELMESWLHLRPFPEAQAVLRDLQAYRRFVLSNGSPAMLHPLLKNSGLSSYVDLVLSADTVQIYKPAPQVYELALRHLELPVRQVVFVSANGFDAAGAKAFGFTVCWVNRLGAEGEELGLKPDLTLSSLVGLKEFVQAYL